MDETLRKQTGRARPRPPRYAGTAPRRFVAVTLPATLACLLFGTAALVGWVPVSVVSARPLEIGSSAGVVDSLRLQPGTEQLLTGRSASAPHAVAMIRVRGADFEDLCLVPRFRVPFLGPLSVGVRSLAPVSIAHVALAAGDTRLDGVALPRTRVGGAVDQSAGWPALASSGEGSGDIGLGRLRMQSYGLVLTDGIDVRRIRLRAARDQRVC